MKCCGVVNADDWRNNVTNPGWTEGKNKPEGCCKWKKDDNVSCYLTTELQTKNEGSRRFHNHEKSLVERKH